MKNAIQISVAKPCSEKFENFSPTATGGFCGSCQKEVIDFTTMTSKELVKHFNTTAGKTCGRFKASQLKIHKPMMSHKTNASFVSRGLAVMSFSLLSLCAVSNIQAQEVVSNEPLTELTVLGETMTMGKISIEKHTVTGTVLDEENLPLPGVNIVLKGTAIGTQTDFDGKFEFPKTLDLNDVLVFSYIGYGKKEYTITEPLSKAIDITINFDSHDVELMGEVVVGGAFATKRNVFHKFIGIFK